MGQQDTGDERDGVMGTVQGVGDVNQGGDDEDEEEARRPREAALPVCTGAATRLTPPGVIRGPLRTG